MIGVGTIINTAAIFIGGVVGTFAGKIINERMQDTLEKTCGVAVLFLGIAGALEKMFTVSDGKIVTGGSMMLVLCLVLGSFVGELINIEKGFEKFGLWLRKKTKNEEDEGFVDGFLNATFTVCIGAMAIIGSIEDGITGNYTILASKAVLDFIIVMVLTCTMGKGCIFSAIPVFVFQGAVTLLAVLIKPIMTTAALNGISFVGSVLIFCVGINLVWGKKIRVANLLPSLVFAVIASYIV